MKLLPLALLAAATLARAEPPATSAPAAQASKPAEQTTATVRQEPPDEYTQAVVSYPLDMDTLERYATAVHQLRQENDRNPKLMADLRKKAPRQATFAESAARLERQPRLKAIFDKNRITGLDFLLVPSVVQATGVQLFAEQAGHPVPADRTNAGFTALYKANREKVEKLWTPIMADLKAIGMR